jgi:hypothetical protein
MIRWLAHKLGHKSCPQCETLVDFALDGLEPAEQEQVREHLNRCPSCREQVRDFWQVREGLGLCAPECEEPDDFNAKVLARLKEQDQVASMQASIAKHAAEGGDPQRQRPATSDRSLGGWPRFWMALGPVFALMSVFMTAVAAFALMSRRPPVPAPQDELSALSRDLMNDPRAARVRLVAGPRKPGSEGEVVLCPGRAQAFLKAVHLSKCPLGRNYALWMKGADGQPRRLARFAVESDGSSVHVLDLSQPWQGGQGVELMVTQDSGPQAGETWLKGSTKL